MNTGILRSSVAETADNRVWRCTVSPYHLLPDAARDAITVLPCHLGRLHARGQTRRPSPPL